MINADAVCGFVLEQIAWIRERAREGHALVGLFEDDLLLSVAVVYLASADGERVRAVSVTSARRAIQEAIAELPPSADM
eukprot:92503-Rhodomonas_salina.2